MKPLKWIEINSSAIRHNLRWINRRLKAGTELMAVVKADGYGHGAIPIARLALKEGASRLGVLTLEEGLELRRAGIREPIVLLSPLLPEQAAAAARGRFEVTADSLPLLAALNRLSGKVKIHLDLDFGLRRWGIPPSNLPLYVRRLKDSRNLTLAGLSTHFDYLPGKNAIEAEKKLRMFSKSAAWVKQQFPKAVCHAANSSVFLDFPHWQMDMIRIGNLIYGVNASQANAGVKNPWKFYARIIAINRVGKGSSIGYASEYVASHGMTVATLSVGYADGLTMEPAERLIGLGKFGYWGWLRGKKTPFVGRCGISHVLVDVSDVPNPRIGESVLLPIRRTAANPRIPRIYK